MLSDTKVIAIDYNQDASVVQANELVRSKQDELTLLEAKLIRLAISQVVKDDTDLKTYSCSIVELVQFLNISSKNIYSEIQTLTQELIRKCIYIKTPNPKKPNEPNYKLFHWIDTIEYSDGIITFKLSDGLKPYLTGLEKLFTMYPYHALLTLPTSYSIRFYELMCSYERLVIRQHSESYNHIPIAKNEILFTIDELREIFNCRDKYPNTGKFIQRVIEPSIEAVIKQDVMYVSYRTITGGRGGKITHIVFKWMSPLEVVRERAKRALEKNE